MASNRTLGTNSLRDRPDLTLEAAVPHPVAGVDEAGRGPWAGPVVAAAVILPPADVPAGIDDSKRLSRRRRAELFEEIRDKALVGIGEASVREIDTLNILQATLLAMRRAVDALTILPAHVLVDGNRLPDLPCATQAVVKGDSRSLSIAAASIIAKVTRDRSMRELADAFPGYGWERNAGYGTKEHAEALRRIGPTPHHRHSFRPVQDSVDNFRN
jgi:ribonuclease HII